MPKIGIMTSLDANHGSCIFNSSLNKLISGLHPQNEVEFVDFLNGEYRTNELLRALKPNLQIPFYNLKRYQTLKQENRKLTCERIINFHNVARLIDDLNQKDFDTLIVGKVIWDILDHSPFKFPNIYWLSKEIKAKKIAYAVSAHLTDLEKFRANKTQVLDLLSTFRLIGVRDKITQIMMSEAGVDQIVPVTRITDPAFFYEQQPVDPQALFEKYNIDPNRPILGLLYYAREQLSAKICTHYHKMGYQILNFNMFNPYADINIGHLVGIDEWVELIKHLHFCITDRFHVSVFCLRENIPFTTIEPFRPNSLLNSKIYSLLESFNVQTVLYQNIYDEKFNLDQLISNCDEVLVNWDEEISVEIRKNLQINNLEQKQFLEKVNQVIRE
jgi:Polysaccharide pyruvyl transferase.